jgi:hypothetical protein
MIRTAFVFATVVAGATAAFVACSSGSSGGGSGGSPWQGTYSCMGSAAITLGDAGTPLTVPENGSLAVTQNGNALTAVTSSDAGAPCSLTFTANGDNATLDPNQKCSAMGYDLGFTMGTATLAGTSLKSNESFDLSMGGTMAGTGVLTANCTKM